MHNDDVHKTIYSPSPARYHEPKAACFTGFTRNGSTSKYADYNVSGAWNNGWDFYTDYFKTGRSFHLYALNYRSLSYAWGENVSSPKYILLWTAFPASSNCGWALGSSAGDVRPTSSANCDYVSAAYIVIPDHE